MPENLFEPTVQEVAPAAQRAGKPWRLQSQVYVAFFGGPLAIGAIAVLNARRLRLDSRSQLLTVAAAAAGFAIWVAVAAAAGDSANSASAVAQRAIGLVTFGGVHLLQSKADRIYHYYGGGDAAYARLFYPGLAAVFAGLFVEVLLASAVGAYGS